MTALVVFFFAAFGAAFVFGFSKLSLPVRQWLGGDVSRKPSIPAVGPFLVALVECPGCFGWWIGAVVGAVQPEFLQLNAVGIDSLTVSRWGCAVVLGLTTAGVNMLLGKIVGLVE